MTEIPYGDTPAQMSNNEPDIGTPDINSGLLSTLIDRRPASEKKALRGLVKQMRQDRGESTSAVQTRSRSRC